MDFFGDNVIVAYAIGLIMLFFVIRIFYTPIKIALKLVGNAIAGGVFLLFVNIVGGIVDIQLGINIFTALVVGILGVPGAALMLILQAVLGA